MCVIRHNKIFHCLLLWWDKTGVVPKPFQAPWSALGWLWAAWAPPLPAAQRQHSLALARGWHWGFPPPKNKKKENVTILPARQQPADSGQTETTSFKLPRYKMPSLLEGQSITDPSFRRSTESPPASLPASARWSSWLSLCGISWAVHQARPQVQTLDSSILSMAKLPTVLLCLRGV